MMLNRGKSPVYVIRTCNYEKLYWTRFIGPRFIGSINMFLQSAEGGTYVFDLVTFCRRITN